MRRLSLLPILFAAGLLFGAGAVRGEILPPATDLQADGRLSSTQRLPILVFFRSDGCPFCREVEDLYLGPLARENAKTPRVILRVVEIDQTQAMKGFDGAAGDMRAFARQQKVTLVPLIRFFGPEGEVLAPDLRGLSSRDFYAAYLEDSISVAGEKLRRTGR